MAADDHIETKLYLSPKQLAVLDETIARAREEIADLLSMSQLTTKKRRVS